MRLGAFCLFQSSRVRRYRALTTSVVMRLGAFCLFQSFVDLVGEPLDPQSRNAPRRILSISIRLGSASLRLSLSFVVMRLGAFCLFQCLE